MINKPSLLLQFSNKASLEIIEFFEKELRKANITFERVEDIDSGYRYGTVLLLTLDRDQLESTAEKEEMMKLLADEELMDKFTVKSRGSFKGINNVDIDFFTYAETTFLIWSRMDEITLDCENADIFCLLKDKRFYDENDGKALRHVLEDIGFLECIFPVHSKNRSKQVLIESLTLREIWNPKNTLKMMHMYYGEEVAFYFAWLHFYTKQLCIPAMFGTIVLIIRTYRGDTVDTCSVTPLFGIGVMFFWSVIFTERWKSQEYSYAYTWGTFDQTEFRHKIQVRPEFIGDYLEKSPITGKLEKVYPKWKRVRSYIVSYFASLLFLSMSFFVIILSLNLQGYINPNHNPVRWVQEEHHPFYYPSLASLSEKGSMFDVNSYLAFIPVILHTLVINFLNRKYCVIAEYLTDMENHETMVSYENSLVIKRFFFEACDAFLPLIYLAFYERDVAKLRSELISLFLIDTFRRVATETVLPITIQYIERRKKLKNDGIKKKKETFRKDARDDETLQSLVASELAKDHYEIFDDYIEMVIQFAYLTLFASVYPFGSAVAIFANMVEFHSDIFKLTNVYRKPRVLRTSSIGTWQLLISLLVWSSALTNCFIFGYSSRQMMEYLPSFFIIAEDGDQYFADGKGSLVILIVFLLERIILVLGIILSLSFPRIPSDVTTKIDRLAYKNMKSKVR